MDISLCKVKIENNHILHIVSKFNFFRIFIALIFGLPCGILLIWILKNSNNMHWLIIVSAIVLCSILSFASLLFGTLREEVSLNRTAVKAKRSLRYLWLSRSLTKTLPENGRIRLWSEWDDSDFPCIWYNIDVVDKPYVAFCIARQYQIALKFATKLATFLSWNFQNGVPEKEQR